MELIRDKMYTREEVHDILAPETNFTKNSGTWGLHCIVRISNTDDFVFFSTEGAQQGDHKFDESITKEGVLSWQSQPRHHLESKVIQTLIHHNELVNNIYFFWRKTKKDKYIYLGRLAYISHDPYKECPVYFKWQIIDWENK